jgi:hypothetical protein
LLSDLAYNDSASLLSYQAPVSAVEKGKVSKQKEAGVPSFNTGLDNYNEEDSR